MYRIRFHGRGGQGVRTASQVLGTAFFREAYEVQDAPRYGAERRGAPIFAYVRAARSPIAERGVIAAPDLVIVTDESLVALPGAGVLQGLGSRSVMLICGETGPEAWGERLKLAGPVLTLPPAQREGATDRSGAVHAGLRGAGAAARLVGVIRRGTLEAALDEEVGKLGTSASAGIAAGLAAFDAMAAHAGIVAEGAPVPADQWCAPAWIDLPVDPADVSAPDIHAALTSERAQTGTWRTYTPVIDRDLCNRCSWICSTFCPDGAISVGPDHAPHIDLDHCKGCLVCVAVCPPHAIRAVPGGTARAAG